MSRAATVAGAAGPPRINGRAILPVSFAHGCADLCQGAVPALLPFLIAHRGLDLASATFLVTAATIASSVIQPLFGIWSDRLDFPLLAPIGVVIAGLGVGAVGFCQSYAALAGALAISGFGVALFHPEAARLAGRAARGTARGMSYFSVGGNVGFAVGPLAVLVTVGIFGLDATPALAIPGLVAGVVLLRELRGQFSEASENRHAEHHHEAHGPTRWGPFTRLTAAAVARTVAFFALQAFIPIYLIDQLGASKTVGGIALTVMLASGALGTLIGSRWADRWGKRLVLIWMMVPLTLVLLLLPELGLVGCLIALVAVGFLVDAPFATTVVIGQSYLPGRAGLASGITFGLAIGLGGLLAAGLGLLADQTSITTALFTLPAFSIIGMLLAISLPEEEAGAQGPPASAEPVEA
ncbi:MAG: MFS transporter [Solirubrobacterales bacterium]|nr:MFS transporter [Solirubrobacterales bacterium]